MTSIVPYSYTDDDGAERTAYDVWCEECDDFPAQNLTQTQAEVTAEEHEREHTAHREVGDT